MTQPLDEGPMQDDQPRWHLKKEIQLGHLITTVTVALSAVIYIQKIEQRIAVLETDRAHQHERDEQQDKTASQAFTETQKRLDRIDEKLDRLIERSRR